MPCCAQFCQFASGLIAAFGSFCLGSAMVWGSQIGDKIKNGDLGFEADDRLVFWQAGFLSIGAACVCIPFSFLMHQIGRKTSMIIAIVPAIVGWVLICIGTYKETFILGRFLLGLGCGSFCVAAPVYTTEIAETKNRGMLGTFFQLFITLGILYGYITGAVASLQVHNIVSTVPPILLFFCLFFVPKSPIFLAHKGKPEEAQKALQRLRGKDRDISEELKKILEDHGPKENEVKPHLCKSMGGKAAKRALLITMFMMFAQQLGGINAFVFYSTEIFKDANTDLDPKLVTIILGIVMFLVTFVQVVLIDRVGRKILVLCSATSQAVACLVFGVFFIFRDDGQEVHKYSWLLIVMLMVYIVGFSIGMGPIPWLLIGELFDDTIKPLAASIVGAFNWLLAFLISLSFKPIQDAVGAATCFWIFAGVNILCIVFCLFVLPETKKRSFADIQKILAGEKPFSPAQNAFFYGTPSLVIRPYDF